MGRKYVKLYEEHDYVTSTHIETFNEIYENWKSNLKAEWTIINEHDELSPMDWFDKEDEITRGERAAISRDQQLMTKPQMAVMYLMALGKSNEVGADYVKMIDGIEGFGYTDDADAAFNISIAGLADAIGTDSDRTLSYTVSKFKNLIDGVGETQGQSLSPKITRAFSHFSKMEPGQLAIIAADSILDPETSTSNRDNAESRAETQRDAASASRLKRKDADLKIGRSFFELVSQLLGAKLPIETAMKLALSKRSKETGIDSEKIRSAYKNWLSKEKYPLNLYFR